MSHDHNHDHEERELITLVDEQGNETLFEILWPLTEKKNLVKLCSSRYQLTQKKTKTDKLKSKLTHSSKTKMEQKVNCNQSQKTQKTNGTWLKKSSTVYGGVKCSVNIFTLTLKK